MSSARDGAEALAAIERDHIDLLVLDLVMPNIDGFGVLARAQGVRHGESIPVVVVTGADRSSTEMQALRLSPTSALTKPVEAAALTEEVTRLLTTFVRPAPTPNHAGLEPFAWRGSASILQREFRFRREHRIVISPSRSSSSRIESSNRLTCPPLIERDHSPALMPAFAPLSPAARSTPARRRSWRRKYLRVAGSTTAR